MKQYLFLMFLVIGISLTAQTTISQRISKVDSIFEPKLTGKTFIEKLYRGNQYINNDWVKSDILLSTGVMVHDKKIKYNGLLDEIIWLNQYNSGKFIIDKLFVNDFWYKNNLNESVHFKRINVNESTDNPAFDIFAEVAVEGKISLYIQHRIRVTASDDVFQEGRHYSIDIIEENPVYYIKLPSNRYLSMTKIGRRVFLKLFPEQKKAISKLIKDNHLIFKSKNDLIKVIETVNKEIAL